MLINIVVWGAALPISKFAVDSTSAYHFLFFRFIIAAVATLPILLYYLAKTKPSLVTLLKIIGLELLGTSFALGALYVGLAKTSALEASFLTTATPIFITLGGIFFLHEKENGREWAGLVLAFLGTLLLVFEPLVSGETTLANNSVAGNILVITSNISIGLYYLLAKKTYVELPKIMVSSISFWVGTMTFFLLSLSEIGDISLLWNSLQFDLAQPTILWPSLYMGIFGSVIGLTAYIIGQNLIEASEAMLFTYLQPLVYIPLSILLFGDQLRPIMVIAVLTIGFGVFWGERQEDYQKTISRKPNKRATRSRR